MKTIKEKEDKLFSRRELLLEEEFSGKTPSKDEVKNVVTNFLKANKDLLVIKNIKQKYGANIINVLAYVYKDANNLNKFEKINKKVKKEQPKKQEVKDGQEKSKE